MCTNTHKGLGSSPLFLTAYAMIAVSNCYKEILTEIIILKHFVACILKILGLLQVTASLDNMDYTGFHRVVLSILPLEAPSLDSKHPAKMSA